jgi:hypothetical protein
MRTFLYLLIVGVAILLSLKTLGVLVALLLPLLVVGLVLALPLAVVCLLGWAVFAFSRGMCRDPAAADT